MITKEQLFMSAAGMNMPQASPLERAILRLADGLPIGDLLNDSEIKAHFGCTRAHLNDSGRPAPEVIAIVAGVRGGKSLLAVTAAVHDALYANLDALPIHEIARVAIIANTIDNAKATFNLLRGHVEASDTLAAMVLGKPTSDTITLQRDDGRVVEIVVVAAAQAGASVRSRWLVSLILDEAALLGAEDDGRAVTAEALYQGAVTRVRAAIWIVSSPWGPSGLLYQLWREHFGSPGRYLVVHAPTRALNPSYSQAKIDAIRKTMPDVAAREFDAQWIDADSAFFDGVRIDESVRSEPIIAPPEPSSTYYAAWDAATRGNSWTLVVARAVGRVVQVALAKQWTGSKIEPLSPDVVIREVVDVLRPYRVSIVHADSWSFDALRSHAVTHGLILVEHTGDKTPLFSRVKHAFASSAIDLPDDSMLISDLKRARRRANANGIRVELPKTADGRHCDYAPAFVLAVTRALARGGMVDAATLDAAIDAGVRELGEVAIA